MTVLPGWLLRKMSEIKESVLRMKREFVRYVSPEIRSPLNVTHAGLEIDTEGRSGGYGGISSDSESTG